MNANQSLLPPVAEAIMNNCTCAEGSNNSSFCKGEAPTRLTLKFRLLDENNKKMDYKVSKVMVSLSNGGLVALGCCLLGGGGEGRLASMLDTILRGARLASSACFCAASGEFFLPPY
jgi:hypothetical protein